MSTLGSSRPIPKTLTSSLLRIRFSMTSSNCVSPISKAPTTRPFNTVTFTYSTPGVTLTNISRRGLEFGDNGKGDEELVAGAISAR